MCCRQSASAKNAMVISDLIFMVFFHVLRCQYEKHLQSLPLAYWEVPFNEGQRDGHRPIRPRFKEDFSFVAN